nr:3-oxoacyl-[acyl-carrier-protein] synthase 3 protein like [Ipomoea batatas]
MAHRVHRLVQIRRYVYHDVVRLEDLEKIIDCSNVQAYTINSSKVVFIKKRPQNRQFKGSGNYCTSCDRSLQEPFIHCSLGCKVDFVLKHYKDLSPFLRRCTTLQLSPDFFIPQDIGDDDTANSTVVDCDEPKKRSGLYVCRRTDYKIITEEDMASSMSTRRKGIPHRSPLC